MCQVRHTCYGGGVVQPGGADEHRLLAQHDPELDLVLEGSFMDNLAAATRTSSPSEHQQVLDKALEAYEKALDKVLHENGWILGEE